MNNKFFRILIGASIILYLLSACSPVSTPTDVIPTAEPASLKVGIFNYSSFAPLFIAYEEGFFLEQNLNVELIDFGSQSTEFVPALLSKQLDIGAYSFTSSINNAILQGVNVKYVADKGFLNPDGCVTDAFVASTPNLANGSLTDNSNLTGKKIVLVPGGSFEYALDVMLEQAGVTQEVVELSKIADSATRIQSLAAGTIDIAPLSEPWITRAQAQNAGTIWMSFAELLPNMSVGALIYGPSIMEKDHEIGDRFMVAYLKGIQQFNQGKTDRNVEIIAKYTQLSPEEIKLICWTNFQPDARINQDALMNFVKWTNDKGYVDGPLTIDQLLDNSFVDNANRSLNP